MTIPKLREPLSDKGLWVSVISEFIGTFLLVFLVIAVAYVNFSPLNKPPLVPFSIQIILTGCLCGLVVAGIVFVFGFGFYHGSAHLNPAFTLGILVLGKITVVRAVFFTIAQVVGAIFGAGLLYLCFPTMRTSLFPCTILNDTKPLDGAGLEFAGTFALIVFAVGIGDVVERNKYGAAAVATSIGLLIAVIIIIAAPYTGASFNPARSFGPALVFGGKCWSNHWVYWLAPMFGGLVGGGAAFVLQCRDRGTSLPVPVDDDKEKIAV